MFSRFWLGVFSGGVDVGGDCPVGLGLAGIKRDCGSPRCPVQDLTKVLYIQSTRKKKESLSNISGPRPHKGSLYLM